MDIKQPEFEITQADEFKQLDLQDPKACENAENAVIGDLNSPPDEVYQLAADMGGMGFIHSAECEIMHNSALINAHMIHASARLSIPRYFLEEEAYPAMPDNEYGWEKLYAERAALALRPALWPWFG